MAILISILLHTFVHVYFLEMDDRYFQTIDDPDLHIHDEPDLYVKDDPDFHIVDGVETIYEEDLESFENKIVLISSDDELQEIYDTIASDLNEDIITYFTKELATKIIYHTFFFAIHSI
ncbi:hypothetical protein C2G38_2136222 [Gigaspora rosea]|uniref:Uncharacterized protein n=1 Tax=Gigaspora rosea TaxID=44941 RepID=A0A397W7N9_9GLOM|nr:hypothetical protein C2G38_2136222 [Gigaspora rosea]